MPKTSVKKKLPGGRATGTKRYQISAFVDAEQYQVIQRGLAALPDRPSGSNWFRRVMLRAADRALQGHHS